MSLLIAGGCAGNGCSCMAPLPNGFPAEKRQANAAQARLSSSGIAFIEANAPTLVEALVGGPLVFPIPPSQAGANPEICRGLPANEECQVDINVNPQAGDPPRLDLTPKNGNQLGLLLRARVKTKRINTGSGAQVSTKLPFKYDAGIITVDCDLELDTTKSGNPSLSLTADLVFDQDAVTGTTRVSVANTNLADLDNGDISISGGLTCGIADLLKGIFKDQIIGGFKDQIAGTIEEQLCKQCTTNGDCAPSATCGGDGVCYVNGSSPQRCLQELGTSGRMAGADLLATLSPGNTGSLDLYIVAGGYAKANDNGMSLGILGGGIPSDARHDACVPVVAEPSLAPPPESPTIQANTRPDGQPFMVGIGLTKPFLDHAGWAAFDSGFLCLNVGTRSLDLLNTETFNILVDLTPYTHGANSPLILALRPQQPPTFTLGAGTFNGDGTIAEPLIILDMPSLQIDFYVFIDERYSRLFTVQTDLKLPISLDANDMGQIVPVIGDVANAFQNIQVTGADFTQETGAEIAAKFPALLSVAVPFLADAIGPIDLPAVIGLQIKVPKGGITSVDANSVLAIFADLATAAPKPMARVTTEAEVLAVRTPATAVFQQRGKLSAGDRPRVELALGGAAEGGAKPALEWQIKIDGGLWGPWLNDPRFVLTAEQFWLQGRHTVAVRARVAGAPETTDLTPVELPVIIDSIAPDVALSQDGASVIVDADDMVTGAEDLVVAWRFEGGAWTRAAGVPATIPVGAEVDLASLEVQVTDEAGNVGVATGQTAGFHGRVPAGDGGCGCRVGAREGGATRGTLALLGLMAVLGAGVLRRRKLVPFAAAALALAALAATGCGGGAIGDDMMGDDDTPTVVKPGSLGRYVDIAAGGGRVIVAGYEDMYGDLVLSDVDTQGTVKLAPIDGVPDGPVVLDPAGYRGGIKAAGENVGAHTSVAVISGRAVAVYRHVDDNALVFGGEGSEGAGWSRHVIDPGDGTSVTGLYNSLTVDAAGVPGVAYMVANIPDGMGGFTSQLKWAQAASATPTSTADWTITVIHEAPVPCAGLCGPEDANACVKATNTCAVIEGTCGGCGDGTACVGGACVEVLPAPPAVTDLYEGAGLFASAGRMPDGTPVVAFYDRTQGDLLLAAYDGVSAWTVTPLDALAATDTGQWCSLAVGGDGTVHVAYQNAVDDTLRYITFSGGMPGVSELVDDGVRADRPHPVGAASAVVIDATGGVAIAYQDSFDNDVLVARRDAGGVWTHTPLLMGPTGYGFYTSAVVDAGTIWVATFGYSTEKYPPGEVFVTKMP
jgi:MYXO-CTERM domain-containing protein